MSLGPDDPQPRSPRSRARPRVRTPRAPAPRALADVLIAGSPSQAGGDAVRRPGFGNGVDFVAPIRLQMGAGPHPRPQARSRREKRLAGPRLRCELSLGPGPSRGMVARPSRPSHGPLQSLAGSLSQQAPPHKPGPLTRHDRLLRAPSSDPTSPPLPTQTPLTLRAPSSEPTLPPLAERGPHTLRASSSEPTRPPLAERGPPTLHASSSEPTLPPLIERGPPTLRASSSEPARPPLAERGPPSSSGSARAPCSGTQREDPSLARRRRADRRTRATISSPTSTWLGRTREARDPLHGARADPPRSSGPRPHRHPIPRPDPHKHPRPRPTDPQEPRCAS